MHLLITLLLAHLFADFPLQTNRLARLKRTSLKGVFIHVLIYMVVTALLLHQPFRYWPLILGLGAIHFLIDAFKIVCTKLNEVYCFILDQSLHLASVLGATYLVYQYWSPIPVGILPEALLYGSFICALTLAGIVFFWVWTNGLGEEQVRRYMFLHWVKYRALAFEQRVGLVLFAMVFFGQLVSK